MSLQFPSNFELWEFVTSFEDGSLRSTDWNDRTLAVVAVWYLFLLPPREAMDRLERGLRRNHIRFANRPGSLGEGLGAPDEIWPRVMREVLAGFGENDPVAIANRLMPSRVAEAHDKAA